MFIRAVVLVLTGLAAVACSDEMDLPEPRIYRVDPESNVEGHSRLVAIEGANFWGKVKRTLSRSDEFIVNDEFLVTLKLQESDEKVSFPLKNVVHVNTERLLGTVPDNMVPGSYTARVETPHGLDDELKDAFSVVPEEDSDGSGPRVDENDSDIETDTGDGSETEIDTGGGSDTELDSDTGSAIDTDKDSSSDIVTDSQGTDSSTDTGVDTETEIDTNTDTGTNTDTDTDSDTEMTGILSIIALKEDDHNAEYTSGRLNSNFEVPNDAGTVVEARLKLVLGRCSEANRYMDGPWVAFWLLGSNSDEQGYGGTVPWPGCGEILILQWIGQYGDTYYTTNQKGSPVFEVDHDVPGNVNFTTGPEQWHVYGVRFNGDTITFTFDGEDMSTKIYNDAEDHTHRILLNMAIGGDLAGIVDENFNQDMLQVDWVRVMDADGELLWADEMNDEAFTRANWFPYVGMAYNDEMQYYTNWESDNFQWHGDFTLGECDADGM